MPADSRCSNVLACRSWLSTLMEDSSPALPTVVSIYKLAKWFLSVNPDHSPSDMEVFNLLIFVKSVSSNSEFQSLLTSAIHQEYSYPSLSSQSEPSLTSWQI